MFGVSQRTIQRALKEGKTQVCQDQAAGGRQSVTGNGFKGVNG
jgi:hypothetical protein